MSDDRKVSEAARALGKLGAAEGGKARAARLSPEERSDSARQAAAARWGTPPTSLPVAKYGARERPLRIGDIEIPAYVLADGRRVLAQRGLQSGIGLSEGGLKGGARKMAALMANLEEKGIDTKGLVARANSPIRFIPPHGGNPADGYEATILPDICAVIIEAGQKRVLHKRLSHLPGRCAVLQHGFATVGIIALVDEATGFQDVRARDSLAKILEAFVAKELRPWIRTFQPEFYKEMFRLRGIPYTGAPQRPSYIGHLTNDLVWRRLAPGVLDDLRRKNPVTETGRRRHKHFQWLTDDIGDPKLREHLVIVTALMKAEDDWDVFKRKLDRVCPAYGKTLTLALPEPDEKGLI